MQPQEQGLEEFSLTSRLLRLSWLRFQKDRADTATRTVRLHCHFHSRETTLRHDATAISIEAFHLDTPSAKCTFASCLKVSIDSNRRLDK